MSCNKCRKALIVKADQPRTSPTIGLRRGALTKMKWPLPRRFEMSMICLAAWMFSGCGGEAIINQGASLGSNQAGGRGLAPIVFINNTPYRAVFTFGSYDQFDPDYRPDASQFGLEGSTLEGNDSTNVGLLECARVLSVGGRRMLDLIDRNFPDTERDEAAFIEGVAFYDPGVGSGDPVLVGMAPPFEALLGVDFPCGSLLIVRFEFDDLGPLPFRVDFELIVPETPR